MYRVSEEEILASQVEYKKNYPEFKPFHLSGENLAHVSYCFMSVLTTQNGADTDDYSITDNNKVEKYLSDVPAGDKVLILGTGTGREVLVAKDLGMDAVGTTLGSRNVYFGINYLGLKDTEILECPNEALPFDMGTFDVVAGFQVFEHAVAPLLFILEQTRVLKVGGKLILEWPPADKFNMEDNPHHQMCFSPGQAKALFQKAGLCDIKLYYDDMATIPEEDYWRCDQNKMLCIEGKKEPSSQAYIQMCRNL